MYDEDYHTINILRMSILFYYPGRLYGGPDTGGTRRYKELMLSIAKKHHVTFYSHDYIEDVPKDIGIWKRIEIPHSGVFKKVPMGISVFFANLILFWHLSKTQWDAVVLADVPSATPFCLLNTKHIKLIIWQDLIACSNLRMRKEKGALYKNLYKLMLNVSERICLAKAEQIVVQCKYDLEQLVARHTGMRDNINKKSRILINNINSTWAITNLKSTKANDIYSKKSYCHIGFVGRFEKLKGYDILLKVVASLLNEGRSVFLSLIGDGEDLVNAKETYKKYENIKFYGRMNNPYEVITNCDLIVVPSRMDSCPNVISEALLAEIPVIASNVGGIPELLPIKDALFEPVEVDLYNKVKKLLDIAELDKLRNAENQYSQSLRFDWDAQMERIFNIK